MQVCVVNLRAEPRHTPPPASLAGPAPLSASACQLGTLAGSSLHVAYSTSPHRNIPPVMKDSDVPNGAR